MGNIARASAGQSQLAGHVVTKSRSDTRTTQQKWERFNVSI